MPLLWLRDCPHLALEVRSVELPTLLHIHGLLDGNQLVLPLP
jgi:hypothetical protein